MKRIAIYIVILALLTLAPVQGAELGKMHPVEVVLIYRQEEEVVIATDTEDVGKGKDGLSALEDLKATTAGTIYLDTAKYLLIGDGAEAAVEQLRGYLKKGVKVCRADKTVALEGVAVYLSVHGNLPRLRSWKAGVNLPKLQMEDGRFLLI